MNWYKKHIYANIQAYTHEDFLRKLRFFNVYYKRQAAGSHILFINQDNGQTATIPVKASGETISPETMKKVIQGLGIDWTIWKKLPKSPKKKDLERIKMHQQIDELLLGEPEKEEEEESYKNEPWYIKQQEYIKNELV